MQNINTSATYRISPVAYPNTYVAFNTNNDLTIAGFANEPSGVSAPLNLTFVPSLIDGSYYYSICATHASPVFCMDQWGNNATQPAFQAQANVSGQIWNLTRQLQSDQSTAWLMQSIFAGPSNFLAAFGVGQDGLAMVSNAPTDDTLFNFIDIDAPTATSSSGTTATTTATSLTSAAVITTIGSSSPRPTSGTDSSVAQDIGAQSKAALSGGAIAGIVVGVVLLIALILGALLLVRRNRRRSRARAEGHGPTSHRPSELATDLDSQHAFSQEKPPRFAASQVQEMRGSPIPREMGDDRQDRHELPSN